MAVIMKQTKTCIWVELFPSTHTDLIKSPKYDLKIMSHSDDLQLNW